MRVTPNRVHQRAGAYRGVFARTVRALWSARRDTSGCRRAAAGLPSLDHMSGTEVWSAGRIRAWLAAGLRDATAVWTANPDRTWDEIGAAVLRELDLREAADFPVVEQLFAHVTRLSTEEQRRGVGAAVGGRGAGG